MIPAAFVPLENLPLTPNGKLDRTSIVKQYRQVLPLPDGSMHSSETTISPRSQTEVTLTNLWQELLRLKQVSIYDNFFELGGHSLLATQMTSRVRDTFGLELPLQSVFAAPTIAQLTAVIETLRQTISIPQAPPLVRLDRTIHQQRRSSLPSRKSRSNGLSVAQSLPLNLPAKIPQSPLVPLTLSSNSSPFFCVHPMFGVVFPYLELAHHLKSDRSFYGLQSLGLDGQHPPCNRIEPMATYYIQAIQTLQPHGPYFLGGWSFGGLVAFEMAQQLTQAGHEIALLALLDTPAPVANNQPSLSQSLNLLKTAFRSIPPFLLDYGAIAATRWKIWFSRWPWSAITDAMPEESRLQLLKETAIVPILRIFYANSQAVYGYVPQPYPHPITLFNATEQAIHLQQNPTLGWNLLATNIQLHPIPGNHLSMMKPPHVQTLAQQLQQYL
jgi:thioesterase domain-containing protein/acyl carrier protein